MDIVDITAPVTDLDECRRFYTRLGLLVGTSADGAEVSVRVGRTLMRFRHRPDEPGADHFAFTIPAGKFAAAKRWLQDRVDLLERDGEEEFEGPTGWSSRSVYFSGPSDSVLELIARRDLPGASEGPFTSDDLLSVSEVGIAVPDVLDAAEVATGAGLHPFAAEPGPDFAAVGDQDGLLILVEPGRPWLPTIDRPAAERAVSITAVGPRVASLTLRGARIDLRERVPGRSEQP